jgi:hypothetical protein
VKYKLKTERFYQVLALETEPFFMKTKEPSPLLVNPIFSQKPIAVGLTRSATMVPNWDLK